VPQARRVRERRGNPSGGLDTIGFVLLAKLICSDSDCYEELEISVDTLLKLDGYVCECGHGFVLASVAELKEPEGDVVSIVTRVEPSRIDDRRAA
jgi:hypothetical protein